MTPREWEVITLMEARGGHFVSALAQAWRYADRVNFAKLRTTFANYFEEYEAMLPKEKK
jgi:hypothetical protein